MALFDGPLEAQEAAAKVEASGVDGAAIHLVNEPNVPAPRAMRAADMQVETRVASGVVKGAVAGVAVFVLVGVIFLAILGTPIGWALLFGLVGGVPIGVQIGGFWGGASKIPMNEAAYDTAFVDPRAAEPVALEIKLLPVVDEDRVLATLNELHPTHIERRG